MRFVTDSRPPPTNKTPLRAIGAGAPRAATSSLQEAFEELGLTPCLHMAQILPHPERTQLLIDATHETDRARRHKILHRLVDGYAAVCDMPGMAFYDDLKEMFPDARIVLNGRPDPEGWAQSCRESFGFFFSPWLLAVGFLWSADRAWYRHNMRMTEYFSERYGYPPDEPIFTATMYERHYGRVRADARARGWDLLEFEARDGWAPLCRFLGVGAPDKPFPRANDRKTFQMVKRVFIAKGLLSWAVLGAGVWAAWAYGPLLLSRVLGGR